MSTPHSTRDPAYDVPHDRNQRPAGHSGSYHWMMLACCVPMVGIAIALVATKTAGVGFLGIAIACTAMVALMMRGMRHGDRQRAQNRKGTLR